MTLQTENTESAANATEESKCASMGGNDEPAFDSQGRRVIKQGEGSL